MSALVLSDVWASYGPYKALSGLNFAVGAGEAVTVLGRNGVGKSTLVRVASGLVPIVSGRLEVLGSVIKKPSAHAIARRGVVHLPEGVGLFAGLTIEENLVLRVGGSTRAQRRQRLEHALESLGPLRERRKSRAGQLSGGQQRLVAVSAALAAEPKLLLADEPALGLSPAAADDVYDALSAVQLTNAALVIIETRLGRVNSLCPRAVVLHNGTSIYDGDTSGAGSVLQGLIQPSAE